MWGHKVEKIMWFKARLMALVIRSGRAGWPMALRQKTA
jgi:hypothetical protein